MVKWSDLTLSQQWSDKERFNFIMKYIDGKVNNENNTDSDTTITEPDEPIDEPKDELVCNVSVSVKDGEGNPIPNADVSIYDKGEPYEGTTGSAGGCTIRNVPYGTYTIEASKIDEGYDFTVETITIDSNEMSYELVLNKENDD